MCARRAKRVILVFRVRVRRETTQGRFSNDRSYSHDDDFRDDSNDSNDSNGYEFDNDLGNTPPSLGQSLVDARAHSHYPSLARDPPGQRRAGCASHPARKQLVGLPPIFFLIDYQNLPLSPVL